jgi:hypothetical protein
MWHRSDNLAFAIIMGGGAGVCAGEGVECKIRGVLQVGAGGGAGGGPEEVGGGGRLGALAGVRLQLQLAAPGRRHGLQLPEGHACSCSGLQRGGPGPGAGTTRLRPSPHLHHPPTHPPTHPWQVIDEVKGPVTRKDYELVMAPAGDSLLGKVRRRLVPAPAAGFTWGGLHWRGAEGAARRVAAAARRPGSAGRPCLAPAGP